MPTFRAVDKATAALCAKIVHDHHPELEAADVAFCYRFAHGKDGAPAIKWHGYPAAAVIKINSYADRVEGKDDVTLRIDGDRWKDRPEREKESILRHEFYHLELVKEEDGSVAVDDANRPRLKMRLHDIQIGGFESIIKEFGKDALEAQQLEEVFTRPVVQGLLNWG